MTKRIVEHYPVLKLPENLREGLEPTAEVRVTIESEPVDRPPEHVMTLDEMFALRRPPYRTSEEIVAEVRRHRDGWDD